MVKEIPSEVAPKYEGCVDVVWWFIPEMVKWDDKWPPIIFKQTFPGHCVGVNVERLLESPNPVAAHYNPSG